MSMDSPSPETAPNYRVRRAEEPVALTGEPWTRADVLTLDCYPWYKSGRQQRTEARLLYDAEALYLQFLASDAYSAAAARELNGPVCQDSCVEFFANPAPETSGEYVNVETNCCGALHMGIGPGRYGRRYIERELAEQIEIAAALPGPTKSPEPTDDRWWVAVRLPMATLSAFVGETVSPGPGTVWRANLYRCGGTVDPQYACWSPIGVPRPDYHRPEYFGRLDFE